MRLIGTVMEGRSVGRSVVNIPLILNSPIFYFSNVAREE